MRFLLGLLLVLPSLLSSLEENFLLFDDSSNTYLVDMGELSEQRVSPCSTFKVALSAIGFDSGILVDADSPCWPFCEGYSDYCLSWKEAQSPSSWMARSCVWYSQLLVRHLGSDSLQTYLDRLQYGNCDISGGVDRCWLSSSLEISPREQVAFLRKLARRELPLSLEAQQKTKEILYLETLHNGSSLYGKTGLGNTPSGELGWFVGWIEEGDRLYIFTYQVRGDVVDRPARITRALELLAIALGK